MLNNGALEIVTDFFSCLFLIEKTTGGWRPVIDLSLQNHSIQLTKFGMETVALVMFSFRKGNVMPSLKRRDACFQILIYLESWNYSHIIVEGIVYQFKAMCFSLLTASQLFTHPFEFVLTWAHSSGIHLFYYLNIWLVILQSPALPSIEIKFSSCVKT